MRQDVDPVRILPGVAEIDVRKDPNEREYDEACVKVPKMCVGNNVGTQRILAPRLNTFP